MFRVSTHLCRSMIVSGLATASVLMTGCTGARVNRMVSSAQEFVISHESRDIDEPSKLSPALQRLADASETSRDVDGPDTVAVGPSRDEVGTPVAGTKDLFQVVIHVTADVDMKALEAAGAFVQTRMQDIIYATVHARDLAAVSDVPGVLKVDPIGGGHLPTPPKGGFGTTPPGAARGVESGTADAVQFNHQGLTGKGVIVAILDTGIDWRHADFKNPDGTSRIKYLWDIFDNTWATSNYTVGSAPPMFWEPGKPMGTLYTNDQVNAALKGQITIPRTDKIGHGTACAGTAAGNGLGVAPDAELIVVDTYDDKADEENDGSGSVPAAAWIRQIAAKEHKPCVMSLSFGGSLNPHDGTGGWEDGFNQILDQGKAPGVVICASAGNDGQNSMHARGHFGPAVDAEVTNGMSSPVELIVTRKTTLAAYFDSKDDWGMLIEGHDKFLFGQDKKAGYLKIYKKKMGAKSQADLGVAGSDNLTQEDQTTVKTAYANKAYDMELLPSGTDAVVAELQPGTYFVVGGGRSTNVKKGVFDLYLPDSSSASFGMGGDHKMVVGSPGDATSIITVGSYDCCNTWENILGTKTYSGQVNLGNISDFSSAGFRRDGVVKPDIAGPGNFIISAFAKGSTLSHGDVTMTKDGQHVAWRGTSASCPYTAGVVALMLQKNAQLSANQTKQILHDTADHDLQVTGAVPNVEWGYGKLNPEAAIAAVKAGAAIVPATEPAPVISPAPAPTTRAVLRTGFEGTFTGEGISIKLTAAGEDNFTGEMTRGGKAFPLTAKNVVGELQGTASNNGHDFAFTAELDGDKLTLHANDKAFALSRKNAD